MGRKIQFEGPSLADPRLHVAAVLLTVQVLGQTVIDNWDLSIAQVLVCLGVAFVVDLGIVAVRRGVLAWPASALLTGNGVALILRVPGTEHGDWFSLRGWWIFAGCTVGSVVSKYLIRVGGRPLFNPNNLGLVVTFLLLGSTRVDPQDFWWGPWSPGLAVTYGALLGGGYVVVRRLHLEAVAVGFWVAFAAALALVAASGHAITARWHVGLLTGFDFWWVVVSSPEILIFLFFMITDPRTIPRGRSARIVHAVLVGLLSATFAAPQRTEWGTKVAVLAGLTVALALRPLLERVLPEGAELRFTPRRALAGLGAAALLAGVLVVAGEHSRVLLPDDLPGDRPTVATGPIPPVAVDDSVDGVQTTFPLSTVDDLGRDLVEDLALEGEALRTADQDLATQAAAGKRLDELRATIAEGDPVTVPVHHVEELTLILHRELAVGQAAPRLGLLTRGTVRLDRAVDGRVTRGSSRRAEAVYLLTEVDGHWLVDDERPVPDQYR